MRSLIGWNESETDADILFIRPKPLTTEEWPPDYQSIWRWRHKTLEAMIGNAEMIEAAKAYYASQPAHVFICDWMDTYDPRRTDFKWVPFVLFAKQADFIDFLHDLDRDQEGGLVEKSRDMGITWCAAAYSVWSFLFEDDTATGWGSRKQDLVDKLGDPDSIFEKMRLILKRLPSVFLPKEFNKSRNSTLMKLTNPENGSIVAGESGDNIGRGGRKSRYFKDEAQPLTSPVLTPSGWSTMGDIQPGDDVIGVDGRFTRITHINQCGVHETYRLTFSDGTTTECSENHLWQVNKRESKKPITMRTCELHKKYKYTSPKGQVKYNYSVPVCKPIEFSKGKELPLNPYVVGALIGDGSLGSVPSHSPKITTIDEEIVNQFRDLLPEWCTIKQEKGRPTWRLGDVRGRQGWKHKCRIRQTIVEIGLAGHRSYEKFIPDMYKFAKPEERFALLQGLMDTDGSASGGVASFHTCSSRLADDVRFIVQSLGGTATLNVKADKRGYRDMYVLHVCVPEFPAPFRLSRKTERLTARKHKAGRSIVKIEHIGKQEVKCITVENSDGLYLTDNCIVTHNSAHYERPEKIEAALGDNTNVPVDISSVNGLGNVFHRRREGGITWEKGKKIDKGFVRVFVMGWEDHPMKTQEWYDARKARYEREGLQHVFAQEVDRNYSAAVSNTIISYDWIKSSIDAHIKVPYIAKDYELNKGVWMAGLDLADQGEDRNALTLREWIIWRHVEEWGERDPGVSARKAIAACRPYAGRIQCMYDSIGIGATVKSEYNRLTQDEGIINAAEIPFVPWNAGASVLKPFERIIKDDEKSLMNKDFFDNLKAQGWWSLRTRFYKTYKAVTEGVVYPTEELISLDSKMPLLEQLCKELAQPTRGLSGRLKMLVEKAPKGTKSPNLADSGMEAYYPVPHDASQVQVGSYGH